MASNSGDNGNKLQRIVETKISAQQKKIETKNDTRTKTENKQSEGF